MIGVHHPNLNEKPFEQKLSILENKLEKHIQKTNVQLEEKLERKLSLAQEQLIKHYESENEVLEMRLSKSLKVHTDDELNTKIKHTIDTTLREQKNEMEKILKLQYTSLNENFKVKLIILNFC